MNFGKKKSALDKKDYQKNSKLIKQLFSTVSTVREKTLEKNG